MGVVYVASLVLSLALGFTLGLRGLALTLITILGSVLGFIVAYAIIGLVRPARVELHPPTDLRVRFPDAPCEEDQTQRRNE